MANTPAVTPDEKKMLHRSFYYSLGYALGSSRVTMQSKMFASAMYPALKKYYDNEEDIKEAFYRHASEYYNSHQVFTGLIVGIALAMEKENAKNKEIDLGEAISSVKASLMGPLAGIGDSLFLNCYRIIISGICLGIAKGGNPLGVILFILLYGGVMWLCKYLLLYNGFRYGSTLIGEAFKKGIIPLITESAGLLGAIMVGVLIANNVSITVALEPSINGAVVSIQSILDSIMPGILSLLVWGWSFSRIQKGWSPNKLIFTIMGACIVLALFGVF